jgi:serine/threonine protein kinase/tetratricopeptide (TPR) repeat protein
VFRRTALVRENAFVKIDGDYTNQAKRTAMELAVHHCPRCGKRFFVASTGGNRPPRCGHCGTALERLPASPEPPEEAFPPDELLEKFLSEPSTLLATRWAQEAGWSVGQEVLPGFLIQGELGTGGMGRVLLVERTSSGHQYAVKTAHAGRDPTRRAAFLAELWTWIDLPYHPHIVTCRFFRTIKEEVAIFADYVAGPPLAKLICRRSLRGIEQRLDIAIQSAWALEAIHGLGLVHQDVKPANLLIGLDGVLQITDFGLTAARARRKPGVPSLTAETGTPAYRSPEQAKGLKVDHTTDIWGWGLTVLEMFTAELHSRPGEIAAHHLEQVSKRKDLWFPLPGALTRVVERCFRPAPADRWDSVAEVADHLRKIYQELVGKPYPRDRSSLLSPSPSSHNAPNRWTSWGYEWDDPTPHLARVLAVEGRGDAASIANGIAAATASSNTGRALVDVALFEDVLRRYRRLVRCGRKDLKKELYTVCAEKASVHAYLGDASGAQALFAEAQNVLCSIVPQTMQESFEDGALDLNKGLAFLHLEDAGAALRAYARGARIFKALIRHGYAIECGNHFAKICYGIGQALTHLGRPTEAIPWFCCAIEMREWLLSHGRFEVSQELAESYIATASYIVPTKPDAAIDFSERTIRLLSCRADTGDPNRTAVLAHASVIIGRALMQKGKYRAAVKACKRGVTQLDRLSLDRPEMRVRLAEAIASRAQISEAMDEFDEALSLWGQAIAAYQSAVYSAGQYEYESELQDSIRARNRLLEMPRPWWRRIVSRLKQYLK